MLPEELDRRAQRDPGRLIHGEAIGARAQSGQGDALAVVFDGQLQAPPVRAGQQFGLAAPATVPNRADGVNHVFRRQLAGRGDDGRAGGATLGVAAIRVLHDLWPPAAVDRPVYAAAARQAAIRRVHDRIHRLLRDVALVQFERLTLDFDAHGTFSPRGPLVFCENSPLVFRENNVKLPCRGSILRSVYATITGGEGKPSRSQAMRIFGSLCLLLLLWPMSAAARDIFVDNVAGDDRATGHQSHHAPDGSGPIQTIGKALHRAQGGDAIVLANTQRPYRESISLVGSCHSGTAQEPFTLRGNGAILDGSAPVPPAAWENYAGPVFRFRPPHLGCQQLFLDDRPATRVFVARTAGGPPDLRPRQWCLLDGQIYFCVDSTKLPRDYRLRYAHNQTGITLYHVEHVLIADLVVQAFQIDGISLHNSARDVSLAGVTCRGNGRSGVTVGGASLADIDHTLLSDNGQAQLLTLPYSETHARHSRLLGYTAPGWVDQGGRVYLDGKRVESGLDQFPPTPSLEKQP